MSDNRNSKTPVKQSPKGFAAWMANPKFRTIFIGAVSLLLVGIIILVIVLSNQAGSSTDEDDTTSRDERKYELIKNGDFRYAFLYDDEENALYTYPLAPDSWTSEIKAELDSDDKPSNEAGSAARSGIVNTNTDADKGSVFSGYTVNEVGYIADSANAAYGYNPGKPSDAAAADTTGGKKNTSEFSVDRAKYAHDNVLMLYAGNTTKSAVSVKSTSFYVNAGEYAEIRIWVRTLGLTASDNVQIRIQTNEADELYFDGIVADYASNNTATNNGWVEYKFYVSTNLTYGQSVTLQLSMGYASTGTAHPYASGYAFFSDISIKYISQKTYNEAAAIADDEFHPLNDFVKYHNFRSEVGTKELAYANGKFESATLNTYPAAVNGQLTAKPAPHAANGVGQANIVDLDADPTIEDHPFPAGSKALKISNSSYSAYGVVFETNFITDGTYLSVGINRYYKVSIWVKTDEMVSGRGASLYLINKNYTQNRERYPSVWFEGIDTTDITGKDYNYGWVEYTFYIQGSGIDVHDYYLELWLGKRGASGATASDADRALGTAYFANITVSAITLADYQNVSGGTTVKTLSIPSKNPSATIANGSYNTPTNNDLYDYPLNPQNWRIFHAGHGELKYLEDEDYFKTHENDASGLLPRETDDYAAGVINTGVSLDNILNNIVYKDDIPKQTALRDLKKQDLKKQIDPNDFWGDDNTFWDNMIAAANPGITGPNVLMIAAHTATSFGYRSDSISLSAKSYYRLSFKMRTFNIGAGGVNVYLSGLQDYELDAEGNIVLDEDDNYKLTDKKDKINTDAKFLGLDTETQAGNYYGSGVFEMSGTSTVTPGWTEYSIIIITGDNAKTVNLEIWLGGRGYTDTRAEGKNGESCYAFFDNVRLDTFRVDDEKNKNNYDYVNEFADAMKALGIDMDDIAGTNAFENLKLFNYRMEVNETNDTSEIPPEDSEPWTFDWLLIPSIVIAVILLFAVVAFFIRKLTKNIRPARKIKPSSDYKRKPQKVRLATDVDETENEEIEETDIEATPSKNREKPAAPRRVIHEEPVDNKKTDEDDEI